MLAGGRAGVRSDIYAVGVIGYELLSGKPPFAGGSPQQVLAAHVTQAPAPLTQMRATVPPALAEIVMRCLEKNPSDRPQTASELFERFDQLVLGFTLPGKRVPKRKLDLLAAEAHLRVIMDLKSHLPAKFT